MSALVRLKTSSRAAHSSVWKRNHQVAHGEKAMKKSMILVVLASLLILVALGCPPEASAQSCSSNPSACAPVTSYTFGDAKAHGHNNFNWEAGQYCGRWLVSDPTNNGGNNFFGNTICYEHWLYGPTWVYYDWSADPDAAVKISMWSSNPPTIFVTFDQTCLLATSADTTLHW
jgi:hypothetical protein